MHTHRGAVGAAHHETSRAKQRARNNSAVAASQDSRITYLRAYTAAHTHEFTLYQARGLALCELKYTLLCAPPSLTLRPAHIGRAHALSHASCIPAPATPPRSRHPPPATHMTSTPQQELRRCHPCTHEHSRRVSGGEEGGDRDRAVCATRRAHHYSSRLRVPVPVPGLCRARAERRIYAATPGSTPMRPLSARRAATSGPDSCSRRPTIALPRPVLTRATVAGLL